MEEGGGDGVEKTSFHVVYKFNKQFLILKTLKHGDFVQYENLLLKTPTFHDPSRTSKHGDISMT